jgi:type IV secretory pathway VirJ component
MKITIKTLKFIQIFIVGIALFGLNSCSIFKRNRRITTVQGIENNEGGFSHFVYASKNQTSKAIIVILSGDGGWLEFTDELAQKFSNAGYNTLGVNSRNYFWEKRTPDETTDFLFGIIKKYQSLWKERRIVLIGYSFGADIVPFVYNRLPKRTQRQIKVIQLLSPFKTTDFKVSLGDLININSDDKTYNVEDELNKIEIPVVCYYGEQEIPKPMQILKKENISFINLKGGHRYINACDTIVSCVKASLRLTHNNLFAF